MNGREWHKETRRTVIVAGAANVLAGLPSWPSLRPQSWTPAHTGLVTEAEKPVPLEMLAGPADACGAEQQGGEPACFANLVCPECGAVVTEGHAAGCAAAGEA